MITKDFILSHSDFVDNDYLDKYVALINNSSIVNEYKYTVYKHHIIPKAYFNLYKLSIDNSDKNISILTYKDHLYAHYYLYRCTSGDLQYRMLFALKCLLRMNNNLNTSHSDLDEEAVNNIIYNLSKDNFKIKFTKEHSNKISLAEKGKIVSEASRDKMKKSWNYDNHFGNHTSTRENMSIAHLGKSKSDSHKNNIRLALIGHNVSADTRVKLSKNRSCSKGLLDYYTIISDESIINKLIDTYFNKGYSIDYCCKLLNVGTKICRKILIELGYYEGFEHKKLSKLRGVYKGEVYDNITH